MADNKEKDLEGIFSEQEDEALKKELEEIKETFQQELDKATAEAETSEEENENESEPDDEEELTEDMLCECCGENKRGTAKDPESHFCAE